MECKKGYESVYDYPLIDIHAHILYGVDDGARTLEEACRMVKRARAEGIGAIVVTPHYSRRRGVKGYAERFAELKAVVSERFPDLQLYLGQETYYHEELPECLKEGKALTMAESDYVLVEFDPKVSFQAVSDAVRQFLTFRYVPIIAHVERYECLRDEKKLKEICMDGCLLQMNYESIAGHWFSPDVRWCRKQIKEGRIHFLATDMHRIHYRPPEIKPALEWLKKHADQEQVRRMVYENPLRMINNKKIS